MAAPKVSVVMGVYNGERFLSASIRSILDQSFRDFEFIIVDDGSTDSTPLILRNISDRRVKVLRNPRNMGLVRTLNRGISEAKGKYIARMDADDISFPERLMHQVDYMERRPEVGVLGGQAHVINSRGEKIREFNVPLQHGMISWMIFFGWSFAHPSVMIRKKLLRRGYNPDARHCEDAELWTHLFFKTRFANLAEPVILYRKHSGSVTQNNDALGVKRGILKDFFEEVTGVAVSGEDLEDLLALYKEKKGLGTKKREAAERLLLDLYHGMRSHGCEGIEQDLLGRLLQGNRRAFGIAGIGAEGMRTRIARFKKAIPKPLRDAVSSAMRRGTGSHPDERDGTKGSRAKVIYGSSGSLRFGNAADRAGKPKKSGKAGKAGKAEGTENTGRVRRAGEEPGCAGEARLKHLREDAGVSIVILTYNRPGALRENLNALLDQSEKDLEILVCNNHGKKLSGDIHRILGRFRDSKLFESSFNWKVSLRYAVATLAKHDRILFLDDDIILKDREFLSYMLRAYRSLPKGSFLSCWNTLWTWYDDKEIRYVSLAFSKPDISDKPVQTDTCGSGICMFDKSALYERRVMDTVMFPEFPNAGDMSFSLISSVILGSGQYYLPSYGMLRMHEENKKAALYKSTNRLNHRLKMFKKILNMGYKPVLERIRDKGSAERMAARAYALEVRRW